RFAPKSSGQKSAQLDVKATPGGPASVALRGLGATAGANLLFDEAAPYAFGVVDAGLTSTRMLTLTNAGLASAGALPALTTTGDTSCTVTFAVTTTIPQVTLHAEPKNGARFAGWGDDCSGQADCTLNIDATRVVTALFNQQYTLDVKFSGNGHGTVLGCSADC